MDDFQRYMMEQIHWIEVEKWLEGERRGCDPGEEFVRELVKRSGERFRKQYLAAHSADQLQSDEPNE